MLPQDAHLSDEELLLLADGEFPSRRAAQARGHLTACWECRARMGEFERAIAGFVRANHDLLDPQLPLAAGPRALLKARLAESVMISPRKPWYQFFESVLSKRQGLYVGTAFLIAALGMWVGSHRVHHGSQPELTQLGPKLLPNRALTPGVGLAIQRRDVCAMEDNDPAGLIPASVQHQALREYGVAPSQAGEYELDYLIPPALGGTNDIRNLWPEPYSETLWNARVKDTLEDRLQELVCRGQLGLPVAQHAIAANWIGAYKTYFHTNHPPPAAKADANSRI